MARGVAIAAGWAIDQIVGEPPVAVHPVAVFGRLMTAIERRTYRPTRRAGACHAALGLAIGAGTGFVMRHLIGSHAATTAAVAVSVAGRMLASEATTVLELIEDGDIGGARQRARGLVGRSTDDLDSGEVTRAVIESVAENTVDAVVAPLCWAAVAGAPGVLAHRAINTLDAMVGHRSERYERFGWTAARLDDIANYVPARVAASAVAVRVPARAVSVWRTVKRDAGVHPSPNGGVIEAAVAAALGIRLGGTNRYGDRIEERGVLGDGPLPTVADGHRAVRLTTAVGSLVAAVIAATSMIRSTRGTRR